MAKKICFVSLSIFSLSPSLFLYITFRLKNYINKKYLKYTIEQFLEAGINLINYNYLEKNNKQLRKLSEFLYHL